MLFWEIDHGAWLPTYGIHRRAVRWILGNATIAITMIRHDLTAGLFVPVEPLVMEGEDGKGATVTFVLPVVRDGDGRPARAPGGGAGPR